MNDFLYLRAGSIDQAGSFLRKHPEARLLAGGQSLLAAMKLGLCTPSHLVDLQDVPGLGDIERQEDRLWIGAMVSHARVAASPVVRAFAPMLADLAQGIADQQVRELGTIGGSLANNDPAACWPAGILATDATIVTSQREIAADNFFKGLYGTALAAGELLVGLRFVCPTAAHYRKHEQPASRFAMVGVAVARLQRPADTVVRVAVTGLGNGVLRWTAAESALGISWRVASLDRLEFPAADALGDVHATAQYRAHLVGVMCRRAVASLTGEKATRGKAPTTSGSPLPAALAAGPAAPTSAAMAPAPPGTVIKGSHLLTLNLAQVWQGILDPAVLQSCIPGCESLQLVDINQFTATVKVGIGPVSARFQTTLGLQNLQPPSPDGHATCALVFAGQAGGLGRGQGTAQVQLTAQDTGTRLDWQANTQVSGKIAQFGNRLIEATARKLSDEFFERFASALSGTGGVESTDLSIRRVLLALWNRLRQPFLRR